MLSSHTFVVLVLILSLSTLFLLAPLYEKHDAGVALAEADGEGDFTVTPTQSIYEVYFGEVLEIEVRVKNEDEYTAEQDINLWVGGRGTSRNVHVDEVSDLMLDEGEETTVVLSYDVPEEPESNWPSEDEFDIRVTATGGGGVLGITDDKWRSVEVKEVELPPPSAEFSYSPTPPRIDTDIRFDATGSFARVGNIESYEWNMGDRTEKSNAVVEHRYEEYGEYEVSLTVSDGENEDTLTETVVIENIPPEPVLEFESAPDELTVDDEIAVDATDSYNPDGDGIEEYRWDFGDGTTKYGSSSTHSYAEPGSYNLTLTVGDGIDTSSESVIVEIINRPPVASFRHSPDDIVTGEPVIFNASESYNPDGDIEEFRWRLGNDETAHGEAFEYTFEEVGTYDVTLTVDDGEDTDEELVTITVGPGGESADGFGVTVALLSLIVAFFMVGKLRSGTYSTDKVI